MTHEQAIALKQGQKIKYGSSYFEFNSYFAISQVLKSEEGLYYPLESCEIAQEQPITLDLPKHYDTDIYEPLKIIDHYELDFYEGNILKYLLRWRKKDGVKDLEKAADYLDRLIKKVTTG